MDILEVFLIVTAHLDNWSDGFGLLLPNLTRQKAARQSDKQGFFVVIRVRFSLRGKHSQN